MIAGHRCSISGVGGGGTDGRGGTLVERGAKLFSFFLLRWQPRHMGGE
jgi:hypothetical protein